MSRCLRRRTYGALVASLALASAGAAGTAEIDPAVAQALATNPCGPGLFVHALPTTDLIRAAFERSSYSPGTVARLRVTTAAGDLAVQIFHDGVGRLRRNEMVGAAVSSVIRVKAVGHTQTVGVPVGDWPSGLYFARLTASGRITFAPFIVRSKPLGLNRVAVVLPTNTWEAYNFRDDDHNGYGDTWYADPRVRTVDLQRPYVNRGIPPHLGGFVRWFMSLGLAADFYSDDDLEAVQSAEQLAHSYDLIVFPGHEEYVTQHVFSLIEQYRGLGGNLAFLSSNNFFSRVVVNRRRMTCLGHFRVFGESEAGLIGVQYVDWFQNRYPSRPYVVRDLSAAPWLFSGTGLRVGDRFGFSYGIEIDAPAPASPRGTHVLAEITDIFGPGKSARMTYYQTATGAKVFAAGAMGFEGPQSAATERMLENLWAYLSRP